MSKRNQGPPCHQEQVQFENQVPDARESTIRDRRVPIYRNRGLIGDKISHLAKDYWWRRQKRPDSRCGVKFGPKAKGPATIRRIMPPKSPGGYWVGRFESFTYGHMYRDQLCRTVFCCLNPLMDNTVGMYYQSTNPARSIIHAAMTSPCYMDVFSNDGRSATLHGGRDAGEAGRRLRTTGWVCCLAKEKNVESIPEGAG